MMREYAVIGHPMGHTMSPFLHRRLFALSGFPGGYGVLDIPPEALSLPETQARLRGLSGFNITIPHKQAIIPFLDGLDKKAAAFGSVNTVKNEGGRLTGHTTDGDGFLRAIRSDGLSPEGRCLLLGSGGAARAIAFEIVLAGGALTVAAREKSLEKAESLVRDLKALSPRSTPALISLESLPARKDRYDLVINATPVGMYPHPGVSPVGPETIDRCGAVFDAVYNPGETELMRLALSLGKKVCGGMGMLVWQAAMAQSIWTGADFRGGDITALIADAQTELSRAFPPKTLGKEGAAWQKI